MKKSLAYDWQREEGGGVLKGDVTDKIFLPMIDKTQKNSSFFSGYHPLLIIVIFLHNCNCEAKKFYTRKCVNLWQNLSRDEKNHSSQIFSVTPVL